MSSEFNFQIQIDCDLGAIRKTSEWLRTICKDIDADCLAELDLAVVEAVTNIVKHSGIVNQTEKFSLQVSRNNNIIEVVITDSGKPISPSALDFSETVLDFDPQDVANLPTSGLGLAIIREVTDGFEYQTHNCINTMRLIKRI
jgi:serine/threonine-protein kinase RsbW